MGKAVERFESKSTAWEKMSGTVNNIDLGAIDLEIQPVCTA